jgi:hypothetical protein
MGMLSLGESRVYSCISSTILLYFLRLSEKSHDYLSKNAEYYGSKVHTLLSCV